MSDPTNAELEIGEQGEHVTELQERLRNLGHDLQASGVFDEQTQSVLTEFAASRGVADGTTSSAVAQIANETGELQRPEWQARFTAPLNRDYVGEDQPGNATWRGEQLSQTYYPPTAQAANAEFGHELSGGRFVSGAEGASSPEPLDTTGIQTHSRGRGSKPERMLYTMDAKGDFNLADPGAEEAAHPGMRVHHSSVAAGEEVAGAGEMKIRDGVVEQVSDLSGHYRPDFAMTQQVAGALKDQGVDTDKVTFELGNFAPGTVRRTSDTLASGTEVLSYDRDAILNELNPILRRKVDAAGRQKWGGAWDLIDASTRDRDEDAFFKMFAGPYLAMSDRELQNEARKIIQGRHEKLDAVLAQIKGLTKGWREDPLKRHQWRWYDGQAWTAKVSDSSDKAPDTQSTDYEGAQILSPGAAAPSSAPASQQQPEVPVESAYASAPTGSEAGGGYAPGPQLDVSQSLAGAYSAAPLEGEFVGGYAPDPQHDAAVARPGAYAPAPGGAEAVGAYAPDPPLAHAGPSAGAATGRSSDSGPVPSPAPARSSPAPG